MLDGDIGREIALCHRPEAGGDGRGEMAYLVVNNITINHLVIAPALHQPVDNLPGEQSRDGLRVIKARINVQDVHTNSLWFREECGQPGR